MSTVIYLWRLTSLPHVLLSPSSATCRAPESHHGLRSLAYQSTCSQSGRLMERSPGWPATDSDQQTSIHSLCSSSLCAAATRLSQCLESDACAAQLASIPQRIQFKLCSAVYRCLHSACPSHLSRVVLTSEGRSHLRSTAAGDLRIPSAKTVTIGRRGFSVAGPAAWNNLSTTLKDYSSTFTAFKKLLKTELFKSM